MIAIFIIFLVLLLVYMIYLMGSDSTSSNNEVKFEGDSSENTILRILFFWLIK